MKYLKVISTHLFAILVWAALAIYLALEGYWMNAVVEKEDSTEFYAWAVQELETKNLGASCFVLIEDGKVINQYFSSGVDEATLFPTASFSKWITAMSVMSLVEQKKLDLDVPISRYMKRWRLPDSPFDNESVTTRRLLSHTAGLTDGLGFGDYSANEVLPSLEETLRNPRGSSGNKIEIAVGNAPGAEFKYSGGGFLILQLLVEEVSGESFVDYVRTTILEPIGMHRSSYEFLGELENVSGSFDKDGTFAETYQYASAGATGFSSSGTDLAELVELMLMGDGFPISRQTIKSMRKSHGYVMGMGIWGLGTILYVQTPNGDYVFGHDGSNDPAINSTVRINPETADGIVVLVSGHPTLASNIGSEWVLWQTGFPGILLTERAFKSAIIPILIGTLLILLVGFSWVRWYKT